MCPHKKERGSKDSLKTGHFFNFSQDCNPTKRITRSKTGAVAKHPAQEANHYTTHVTRTLENRRETPKTFLSKATLARMGVRTRPWIIRHPCKVAAVKTWVEWLLFTPSNPYHWG